MSADIYITFSHELRSWLLGWPGDWIAITPQEARNSMDANLDPDPRAARVAILDI